MPDAAAGPTPYADVNVVLRTFLEGVQAILGAKLVGVYLGGSLAMGDFTPSRSDIDFAVVTTDPFPQDVVPALADLHVRIADEDPLWGHELEGSYLALSAMRRYDPSQAVHPRIERGGKLNVESHGSEWVIQLYVLRAYGVALVGPPPDTLIDPILPGELKEAVRKLFLDWWAPMLENTARLHHPGYQTYAVLTMCRILYTMKFGTVVSKSAAAGWAQTSLGETERELVARALGWRNGESFEHLAETMDLMRYTLETAIQPIA